MCDCGNYRNVAKYTLTHGKVQTCTDKKCQYAYEYRTNKKRQTNQYEIIDDYVIGYTNKNHQKFYFDLDDYDIVKNYCWYIDNTGYVRTNTFDLSTHRRGYLYMHNLVMKLPNDGSVIADHIGGSNTKNDNRKINLRISTRSQNNINQKTRKDNKSGVKGVDYSISHRKWAARIQVNKKRINLGYFDSFEEAKQARIYAENKYHKEFSYNNSQKILEDNNETLLRHIKNKEFR